MKSFPLQRLNGLYHHQTQRMAVKSSFVFFLLTTPITTTPRCSKLKSPRVKITAISCSDLQYDIDNLVNKKKSSIKRSHGELSLDSFWSCSCSCGRRRFIEGTALAMFPICPSNASNLHSDDYMVHFFPKPTINVHTLHILYFILFLLKKRYSWWERTRKKKDFFIILWQLNLLWLKYAFSSLKKLVQVCFFNKVKVTKFS